MTRHLKAAGIGLVAAALAASTLAGAPAQAIAGGSPVPDGSYRFMTKLDIGDHSCSGAFIAAQWVITARSCFVDSANPTAEIPNGPPKQATTATVGSSNLSGTTGYVRAVTEIVANEQDLVTGRYSARDVVLAKLATPITAVVPAKIRSTPAVVGEELRVAGYGRTSTEWVPDRAHSALFTVDAVNAGTLDVTSATGAATCKGDAGGPVFSEVGGVAELAAVSRTSWQHGCLDSDETRQGATATRVDAFTWWIMRTTTPHFHTFKSGQCVGIAGSSTVRNAAVVQTSCVQDAPDQIWYLEWRTTGFWIRNQNGYCLTVNGASKVRGAILVQWDCTAGVVNQLWNIPQDNTNPHRTPYKIANSQKLTTGLNPCVGVKDASTASGANLVQWDCASGSRDQFWSLDDLPAYVVIRP